MTRSPITRTIAHRLRDHLARNRPAAHTHNRNPVAPIPDAEAIKSIVEAAFWASLRREEGRTPLISLAYVEPALVLDALIFERTAALAPEALTRVAPAVERPGIHLGVWAERGNLRVWGATRVLPRYCFVLEVIAPGFLIIKQSPGEESGKFVNVAVLQGDEIKVVDQMAGAPDGPNLLGRLLAPESQHAPAESMGALIQIAVSMRAHGRGGTMLVVPARADAWRESILHPIVYSVAPAFSVLTELMNREPPTRAERWWQDALRRAIESVAGLTAVDGATIITDRYELLGFGAKIIRRPGCEPVARVIVTEPIEDSVSALIEPAQLGGTRHLSAAQFENDQRDSIALVASQDGRFTVFAWSPGAGMVHAHRIEALLL